MDELPHGYFDHAVLQKDGRNERWDTKLPIQRQTFWIQFGLWILSTCYLERMWCVGPTHAQWHVWIGYLRWQNHCTTVLYVWRLPRGWTIGELIVTVYILGKWTCHTSRTFIFYFYLYANVFFQFVFSVDDELQHLITVETIARVHSRCPHCRDELASFLGFPHFTGRAWERG